MWIVQFILSGIVGVLFNWKVNLFFFVFNFALLNVSMLLDDYCMMAYVNVVYSFVGFAVHYYYEVIKERRRV